MFGPFKRKLTPRPSHAPGAPSVTQTATHIGDLGTWITQCPAVCRPPPGKTQAAGSLRAERLGGLGRDGLRSMDAPGASCIFAGKVRELPGPEPGSAPLAPGGLAATPQPVLAFLEKPPPAGLSGAWRKGPRRAPSGTAGLAGRRGPAGGDRHLPELSTWASASRRNDPDATPGPQSRLGTGCELEARSRETKARGCGFGSWPCTCAGAN